MNEYKMFSSEEEYQRYLTKNARNNAIKEFAKKSNSIIDSLLEKYSVAGFDEFKAICQVLRGLRNDIANLKKEMVIEVK